MPSSTIPRGNILNTFIIGPTLTPVSVAGATSAPQNFTIGGLLVNDFVNVTSSVVQTAGIGITNARVTAANTLTVDFENATAGALTPAAGLYFVAIDRAESFPLPTSAG